MGKKQNFLWAVQTIVLANAINIQTEDPKYLKKYKHVMSASGVTGIVVDALYASKDLPESLSASEAAGSFCNYILANLREATEASTGKKMKCPEWFKKT